MVSGALGQISRLCSAFFVTQIRDNFAPPSFFGAPSLGALGSCPCRLPSIRHVLVDCICSCSGGSRHLLTRQPPPP